jgi:hypothetical protein
VDTDSDPRLVTYPIPANMEVSYNPLAVLSVLTKTERPNGRFDHQHTQHRRAGGQEAADAVCHEGEDWQKGLSLRTITEATHGGHEDRPMDHPTSQAARLARQHAYHLPLYKI